MSKEQRSEYMFVFLLIKYFIYPRFRLVQSFVSLFGSQPREKKHTMEGSRLPQMNLQTKNQGQNGCFKSPAIGYVS